MVRVWSALVMRHYNSFCNAGLWLYPFDVPCDPRQKTDLNARFAGKFDFFGRLPARLNIGRFFYSNYHFFLLLEDDSGSGGTYSEILTELMTISSTGAEISPVLLVVSSTELILSTTSSPS